ncbi:TPR domain protein [Geminocystis sp. NIES-3708]|uniref:tetratricopeptide repeat protein n=1 Tax=Geminocystis sp. NIES-3708 TaxID=1615909 RepID=UPI0005FCD4D4|nr:tetratricopeptide repeat protein [Geminocystis sp. NIES-3708]BAQ60449.1 TPR domain protein [Geminocystis sp. NIES-3708]
MDWIAPLKAQQQDFCHRLTLGKLLICEENYLHSEVTVIKKEIIEKIKVESILESEDIANKYDLTYPLREILEAIFYRKLAIEAFLARFGNLVWLDNSKYFQNSESTLINSNFLVKKAPYIKILLKTFQGNHQDIQCNLSCQEAETNNIFIYAICSEKFNNNVPAYSIIFLGFTIVNLLKFKKQQTINISSSDELLYISGLSYYINDILSLGYSFIKLAKISLKKGNFDEAISFYDQAIKQNNVNPKIYLLRGICQYKKDNKQSALIDFSQAIELDNNYDLAYHWKGYIYQELGNYSEALVNYNKEIAINPLNFFAYYKRGFTYEKLHQLFNALDDYNMANTINYNFYQLFYNRGGIYYRLGDKETAIEDYNQALKLKPNFVEAYYNLGIVYQELGNYKEAIRNYRLAIKHNNQYYKAYYNLAILQANLGLYKQSINSYGIALKINPYFIQANYNQKALNILIKKEINIVTKDYDISELSDENNLIVDINGKSEKNYFYDSEN